MKMQQNKAAAAAMQKKTGEQTKKFHFVRKKKFRGKPKIFARWLLPEFRKKTFFSRRTFSLERKREREREWVAWSKKKSFWRRRAWQWRAATRAHTHTHTRKDIFAIFVRARANTLWCARTHATQACSLFPCLSLSLLIGVLYSAHRVKQRERENCILAVQSKSSARFSVLCFDQFSWERTEDLTLCLFLPLWPRRLFSWHLFIVIIQSSTFHREVLFCVYNLWRSEFWLEKEKHQLWPSLIYPKKDRLCGRQSPQKTGIFDVDVDVRNVVFGDKVTKIWKLGECFFLLLHRSGLWARKNRPKFFVFSKHVRFDNDVNSDDDISRELTFEVDSDSDSERSEEFWVIIVSRISWVFFVVPVIGWVLFWQWMCYRVETSSTSSKSSTTPDTSTGRSLRKSTGSRYDSNDDNVGNPSSIYQK